MLFSGTPHSFAVMRRCMRRPWTDSGLSPIIRVSLNPDCALSARLFLKSYTSLTPLISINDGMVILQDCVTMPIKMIVNRVLYLIFYSFCDVMQRHNRNNAPVICSGACHLKGGYVAGVLAELYPDQVNRLIQAAVFVRVSLFL